MAESKGIIRRIDDLGRIVIPREYRKLHGIELGDPVEITALATGEVVIKRVRVENALKEQSARVLNAAAPELLGALLVSDFERFIFCCGERRTEFIDKPIGKWAAKLLRMRSTYSGAADDESAGIKLSAGGHFDTATVLPVHQNGDCYGGLYYLAKSPIGSDALKTLRILSAVIAAAMVSY